MAKFNIRVGLPAYASIAFGLLYLLEICDVVRNPSIGSIVFVVLFTPIALSLSGVLMLDAVEAYDLPWERAREWYSFLYETPHGALILSIGGFLWFLVLATVSAGFIMTTFGGSGTYTSLLNLFRYIPLIGYLLASAWHILNACVLIGLFPYVIYAGLAALKRLVTTRRTGYVENGVPIESPRQPDDIEDADFEGWQSNRG